MDEQQRRLWDRIRNFELDHPNQAFNFTDRLARENGWTYAYALAAVVEYKRFIFLICISDKPLSPSDQVDQVWHLHLIYTESYWIDFCKKTLFKKIHHGPTRGGKEEKDKYEELYSFTLERYKEIFMENPPQDIWPSSQERFKDLQFCRINMDKNWVIKKPFIT
ncbi:MAG: hypothetical protein K1X55_09415 [Chitinophagales bacterium]|nr:hypothetical protein [Chitinophagales bacterium]